MLPNKHQSQLMSYYEDQMLKRAGQRRESGYAGIGFQWFGYPTYLGAAGLSTGVSLPEQQSSTAPIPPESPVAAAADEAGATIN